MSIFLPQGRPLVFKVCGVEFILFSNTIVQKHTAHHIGRDGLFPQETEFFVALLFVWKIHHWNHRIYGAFWITIPLGIPCIPCEKHCIVFPLWLPFKMLIFFNLWIFYNFVNLGWLRVSWNWTQSLIALHAYWVTLSNLFELFMSGLSYLWREKNSPGDTWWFWEVMRSSSVDLWHSAKLSGETLSSRLHCIYHHTH